MFAVKYMNLKEAMRTKALMMIKKEHLAMKKVSSRFVMPLHYSFIDNEFNACLVMKMMQGGDLTFYLNKHEYFDDNTTRFYVASIILGLEALHRGGWVWRDLKPLNILLDSAGNLCLSDFGVAEPFFKRPTKRLKGKWTVDL